MKNKLIDWLIDWWNPKNCFQTPASHISLRGATIQESIRSSDDSSSDDALSTLHKSPLHKNNEHTVSITQNSSEPLYLVFDTKEEKVCFRSFRLVSETSKLELVLFVWSQLQSQLHEIVVRLISPKKLLFQKHKKSSR